MVKHHWEVCISRHISKIVNVLKCVHSVSYGDIHDWRGQKKAKVDTGTHFRRVYKNVLEVESDSTVVMHYENNFQQSQQNGPLLTHWGRVTHICVGE